MEQLVLTRKEAMKVLRIGPTTFDALIRKEKDPVPSIRVGHKIMVPTSALTDWIERQTAKTAE